MSQALAIANNQGRKYDYAPNESIAFLLSAVETAGQFDMAEMELGYSGGPPLHVHTEQDETHYILKGKLRYQVGEETQETKPGDCVYIPKGTPHAWINFEQESAKILVLLTPGGSEGFFQAISSLPAEQMTPESLAGVAQDYGTKIVGPPLTLDSETNS